MARKTIVGFMAAALATGAAKGDVLYDNGGSPDSIGADAPGRHLTDTVQAEDFVPGS